MNQTTELTSRIIKSCQKCGKPFKSYRHEERSFCTQRCSYDSRKGIPIIEKNGKEVPCSTCEKPVYKSLSRLKRSKNHFCSTKCQIEFQSRDKVKFNCKTCGSGFRISKSQVEKSEKRGHSVLYCSIDCRNNDKKRMSQKSYEANQKRVEKYGLTSFEKAGRKWLLSLGLKKDVHFKEQQLLFERVSVDVCFINKNIVIQFDGSYWHDKPERKSIDKKQDSFLKSKGFEVLRISDLEVKKDGFKKFNDVLKNLIDGI